jgi:hypothetical protein
LAIIYAADIDIAFGYFIAISVSFHGIIDSFQPFSLYAFAIICRLIAMIIIAIIILLITPC